MSTRANSPMCSGSTVSAQPHQRRGSNRDRPSHRGGCVSTHVIEVLDGRLQRRVGMALRRDAAQAMSNGRMVYDALFSRTGIQTYGDSVEYRPDAEVFSAASRAS